MGDGCVAHALSFTLQTIRPQGGLRVPLLSGKALSLVGTGFQVNMGFLKVCTINCKFL